MSNQPYDRRQAFWKLPEKRVKIVVIHGSDTRSIAAAEDELSELVAQGWQIVAGGSGGLSFVVLQK